MDLLRKYCLSSGISGNEDDVRDEIIKELSGCGVDYKVDALGNLIVFKKGRKRPSTKLMVAAHMDEVGLIVNHITQQGYLGFDKVGGMNTNILPGTNVLVGENKIPGVIGLKPIHLTKKTELTQPINIKELFIDIGARDSDDAQKYINLGDAAVFDSCFDCTNNRIISKALDDRSGCFILTNMLKTDLEYDTYFVFTVQEEIGLRGAKTAAYAVNPDSAIVIEATTANDIVGSDESDKICELNKGPAVSFMDRASLYNKKYYKLAMSLAERNNIPIQTKAGVTGGNDAGSINLSRGGVKTIALSVPCRYLHTPAGIISRNDLENTYKLALLLAEEISSM